MKKILIIGIKGMAGHLLFNYYKESCQFEAFGIARNIQQNDNIFDIDVTDVEKVENILKEFQFDYVVNCIGILNKDAEDNPEKAIWFNSYFPHFLEKILKETSTALIHISTDCVFSGKKGGYTENDIKDGIGYYAQSKALGEIDNNKDLTIRTSIIGPEINTNGIGLFHWFMMRSENECLKGYTHAFWSGITTFELAKVVEKAIEERLTGLVQVTSNSKIDKYHLLQLFNKIYRSNKIKIETDDNYLVDKSLISVRSDFCYNIPEYQTLLEEQLNWIISHPDLYKHYRL
ncbi:SDR family oxidoreductase [Sphingobacterium sp.]|uniref:dTDP-4-dehydrorhamnose reductase family protein n=1 Tax=Sphingobacterium sp. TaxID=341027 RepID=UPI0025859BC5|nr:SDR family oxidoreductase [Sphingobacterium sp.]WET70809.1 MAG: SDR family oxidoreductase [Sphingobacterium sp.]